MDSIWLLFLKIILIINKWTDIVKSLRISCRKFYRNAKKKFLIAHMFEINFFKWLIICSRLRWAHTNHQILLNFTNFPISDTYFNSHGNILNNEM